MVYGIAVFDNKKLLTYGPLPLPDFCPRQVSPFQELKALHQIKDLALKKHKNKFFVKLQLLNFSINGPFITDVMEGKEVYFDQLLGRDSGNNIFVSFFKKFLGCFRFLNFRFFFTY